MGQKISVIIPCFNTGAYIRHAVESVLRQTYDNYEVIVVNDGSTDDTYNILIPYIQSGKIRYHYQNNSGLSSARNAGIAICNGDYIALLDADDIWESNKLSLQANFVKASPDTGMVFTGYDIFNEQGLITRNANSVKFREKVPLSFHDLFNQLNFIYPSTVMIHKSVFETCGYFDTTLKAIEDYDMWLRISRQFKIFGINKSLARIRVHGANMSRNFKNMLKNELSVIEKYRSETGRTTFLKRQGKSYMITADRAAGCSDRKAAFGYFIQGISAYPFALNDIFVVFLKLILPNSFIIRLRKAIELNGILRKLYLFFYRRY